VLQLWDRARPVVRTSGRARDRRRCPDAPAAAVDGERDRGAAGGPDEAFNKRYTHLDHYKSADAQGTRFYYDQGTPLNPEQAAQYEAQHHHAPAEHVDATGIEHQQAH